MALTTLSYKEAQKIIDLYASILLESENLGIYGRFRYSQLKGYDIFDIDNALKLTSAYRVFKCKERNKVAIEKLRLDANVDGGSIMSFFNLFEPDNIVQQLNKIDLTNASEAIVKHREIRGDYFQSDLWRAFSKLENHESFLDYCLQLNVADEDYWEKIYDRLGITWDERDEYDEIYFILKNKAYFFNNNVVKGENLGVDAEVQNVETKSDSFYTRYKLYINNITWLLLLSLGLVYVPVRIGVFVILALVGLTTLIVLRKEQIDNKLRYILDYVYIVIYGIGIFVKEAGFYICILAIALALYSFIIEINSLQRVSPFEG